MAIITVDYTPDANWHQLTPAESVAVFGSDVTAALVPAANWPGASSGSGYVMNPLVPSGTPDDSTGTAVSFVAPACDQAVVVSASLDFTWFDLVGGQPDSSITLGIGSMLGGGPIAFQSLPLVSGVPTTISVSNPVTTAQLAAGVFIVAYSEVGISMTADNGFSVTNRSATLEFDDALCAAAGCVGEATHLDDCGVDQYAQLLQQTVDALRPQVRWDCACDSGAANTVVWQKFSSTDNGLTWTLLGTFTEEYGTTPATIVGPVVDCATVGAGATGHRARRAVLPAGSTTLIPSGLPSVGLLVESLSFASRNGTGSITDSAGTVSSFVAGEGNTWDMEWDSSASLSITVTTGDVVLAWVELV